MGIAIDKMKHPEYSAYIEDWQKWRDCYQGGSIFKQRYLERLSVREDTTDFERRVKLSPVPRFAGAAIDEIANSITVRMPDIKRIDGPKTYLEACEGLNGGVDQRGTNMNAFLAQNITPEMLVMRRAGVFIDKQPLRKGATIRESFGKTPYLYFYPIENIMSWTMTMTSGELSYKALLLKEDYDLYDTDTGLAVGCATRYRRFWIGDYGYVWFQLYYEDITAEPVTYQGEMAGETVWKPTPPERMNIKTIPFVDFCMSKSLMEDVADHQIALLNMESADVAYSYGSNFPFYTEQRDPKSSQMHLKKLDPDTGEPAAQKAEEVKVGTTHGRTYAPDMERPGFIHPSSEPLKASMAKSEQIKRDIRQLVGLSVSTLQPGHASAESKGMDNQSLEAGMANIGLELQNGERRIAKVWAEYEGSQTAASISYPTTYALITDDQRQKKALDLLKLQGGAPSRTYQKECGKELATTLFAHKVPHATYVKMLAEIDKAKYITSDPDAIKTDMENGLVSEVTASNARGYDGETEVPIAREEHAERAARILKAQTAVAAADKPGARGVDDLEPDDHSADNEKKVSQRTPDLNKKVGEKKVRS